MSTGLNIMAFYIDISQRTVTNGQRVHNTVCWVGNNVQRDQVNI